MKPTAAAIERMSMMITFLALGSVGVITLLESIRSPDLAFEFKEKNNDGQIENKVKRDQLLLTALQVETVVNVVAAFVYMRMLKSSDPNNIMSLRYADWLLTTPMLLFSLTLYLCHLNQRQGIDQQKPDFLLVIAILLNFFMIGSGYWAEKLKPSNLKYLIIAFGFVCLAGIFITLGFGYAKLGNVENNGKNERNERFWVCAAFAVVWTLYGCGAIFKSETWKNFTYNILDLIAKVFFGFFLYLQVRLIAPALPAAVAT